MTTIATDVGLSDHTTTMFLSVKYDANHVLGYDDEIVLADG